MIKMKIKKKIVFGLTLAFLLSASVVYAAASSDYITKAQKYIDDNCTKAKISNQISLDCYLFYKVGELQASLTGLETSVNSNTSRIVALENTPTPTSKAVKVFDKNGVELGIFMETIFDGYHVFNIFVPSIERYVRIYTAPYSGEVGPRTHVVFTNTNCTGTVYTREITPQTFEILANQVIPISSGTYYALDLNGSQTSIVANSSLSSSGCHTDQNVGTFDVYPLIPVVLPFSEPVALPLQYKYQ